MGMRMFSLRMDDDERTEIRRAASRAGVTLSDFMRAASLAVARQLEARGYELRPKSASELLADAMLKTAMGQAYATQQQSSKGRIAPGPEEETQNDEERAKRAIQKAAELQGRPRDPEASS